MERKKAAKALMVAVALAGVMALGQSFFNEAQATGGGKTCTCTTSPGSNTGVCWKNNGGEHVCNTSGTTKDCTGIINCEK